MPATPRFTPANDPLGSRLEVGLWLLVLKDDSFEIVLEPDGSTFKLSQPTIKTEAKIERIGKNIFVFILFVLNL